MECHTASNRHDNTNGKRLAYCALLPLIRSQYAQDSHVLLKAIYYPPMTGLTGLQRSKHCSRSNQFLSKASESREHPNANIEEIAPIVASIQNRIPRLHFSSHSTPHHISITTSSSANSIPSSPPAPKSHHRHVSPFHQPQTPLYS